jgi:HEAT repeat protein
MDAREALESMPCPEAGQALLAALDTTTGRVKAGIIGSLAVRREVAAGHRLLPLLQSADPGLGTAAALALGSLGDGVACEALGRALATCPPGLRPACAEGLLRCAEQLRDGGDRVGADALCSMLSLAGQGAPIRAAAWTALLLPGDQTVTRLAVALDGGDWVAAQAAVQAAATLEDPAVTRVVAERLGRPAPAPLRVGLLESLARRGDPAATAAVVVACGDADERVRVAALKALAELGDASQVAFLANHAAQAAGAEQAAARDALYRLHRGEVTASLLKLLTEGPAGLRMEVMAALSRRGDAAACDTLLGVATGPDEKAAVSACEALAELAGLAQIERLVQCLVQAQTKAVREAAGKALVNAGRRSGRLDEATAAVLRSVSVAPSEAKAALLRAAGELGGAGALEHLREALADADPGVRTAAVRTLADFTGPEAIPELLGLAKASQESSHRVLALRGYWRLVALSGKRTAEERLGLCRDGLAACERPEEKRLGLGELARIPLAGALELALAAEADEAVRAEAQLALVQICRQTMAADRATAGPLLQRLSTDGAAEQVRTEAGRAMEALHRLASYIMPWLASGPYRQEGKECQQLFAVAFPPEADIDNAEWRPASVPADPALAYQVDLASVVAGNHAVAYIRTRVFAPREQPVALALGVDDGVKLWINGQLVHENNAVRGLNPDEDKAQATLRQGWNDLLAKVTQHTAGCGLCLRLTAPDGALVEGLRVDPAGK